MAEQLSNQQNTDASPEVIAQQDAPETFGGRLRRRLLEVGSDAYNFLDVAAGVSLAKSDIAYAESVTTTLNERFDGMLDRQSAPDAIPMALEADILLDFRLAAQRAGYTDVETMPGEERTAMAQTVAEARSADIVSELQAQHPDWATEDLADAAAAQVRDLAARFAMTTEQRDDYNAAMLQYQEQKAHLPELQQELAELRAERNDHARHLGRVAVRSVVAFAGAVRKLPHEIGVRAAVTGQSAVQAAGNWYGGKNIEGKKAVRFSVLGVALGGLASYVAVRLSMGTTFGGSHNPNVVHVSDTTSLFPNEVHASAPHMPDTIQGQSGMPTEVISGAPAMPTEVNGDIGMPPEVKSAAPATPAEIHAQAPPMPGEVKSQAPLMPEHVGGGVTPEAAGIDLSGADTTKELFGKGRVEKWPTTVHVSGWNSTTKDGSLWGVSEQLLRRSGVKNPSNAQIDTLVDALRPQAQPNGYLQKGQQLHLGPALKALRSLT